MVIQCCQCKKVRDGDNWYTIPLMDETRVSHSYCPTCFANAMTAIHAHRRANAQSALGR